MGLEGVGQRQVWVAGVIFSHTREVGKIHHRVRELLSTPGEGEGSASLIDRAKRLYLMFDVSGSLHSGVIGRLSQLVPTVRVWSVVAPHM